MSRPLRIDYPHAYYHVTSRGNERRAIFKDDQDRSVFLEKLQSSLAIYGVRLHCYVLMDNHFHLVVETPKANLSQFMRHFNVSYTAYYNRRHGRVGHLYQGRFKAIVVEADSYLLELSRYVHLNPVRVGAMRHRGPREWLKYLGRYRWSSLDGYLGYGKRRAWVVYDQVLSYVEGSHRRYGRFVEEGALRGYSTPWEDLKGQVILGREGFWEQVKGRWLKGEGAVKDKERPSLSVLEKKGPEEVLGKVAGYFKLKPEELKKKRGGYRDQRGLVMEVMYRLCGMRQREIGRELGEIGYTQVSHERARIRQKIEHDSKVRRWSREVESLLIAKTKI
ncbi:hypothetical protein EPO44_21265 [bacterium]|nr:MAG: hypothetical protein EPO44_21265 [bacterium]